MAIDVLVLETEGLQLDEVKKLLQKGFKPFLFDRKKEDNMGKEQADYGFKPLEIVVFFFFFFKYCNFDYVDFKENKHVI